VSEIDKEQLYGMFRDNQRWRDGLHRKVAHMAMDIPDEADINVDNRKSGLGVKELAMLAVVGGGGWLVNKWVDQQARPQPEPPAIVAPAPVDTDTRTGIRLGTMDEIKFPPESSE